MPKLGWRSAWPKIPEVPVTFILLAVLGACFLGQNLLPKAWVPGQGILSSRLSVDSLWAAGSNGPRGVFDLHEWWRLISATFLHGSLWHFVLNALALAQLGPIAEATLGRGRTLLTWLATGTLASLASCFYWHWTRGSSVGVGASGAVFGLIGLLIVHFRRRPDAAARHYASRLIEVAILNGVMGFIIPGIDNAAHGGGLIAGAALGAIYPLRESARRAVKRRAATAVLGLATLVALTIAASGAPRRLQLIRRGEQLSHTLVRCANDVILGRLDAPAEARAMAALDLPEEWEPIRTAAVANLRVGGQALGLHALSLQVNSKLLAIAPDLQ